MKLKANFVGMDATCHKGHLPSGKQYPVSDSVFQKHPYLMFQFRKRYLHTLREGGSRWQKLLTACSPFLRIFAVPKRVISCACSLQEPGKVQGIDERNEQKSQKLSLCHWHAILHALDLGHFRSVKNAKSLLRPIKISTCSQRR